MKKILILSVIIYVILAVIDLLVTAHVFINHTINFFTFEKNIILVSACSTYGIFGMLYLMIVPIAVMLSAFIVIKKCENRYINYAYAVIITWSGIMSIVHFFGAVLGIIYGSIQL